METHFEFEAHSSYVLGVLFTADGQNLVSASMYNSVKVLQVPDWESLREFKGHENSVNGKIAVGAIVTRSKRLKKAEEALNKINLDNIDTSGVISEALSELEPNNSNIASKEYRKEVLGVMLKRDLHKLLESI